MDIISIVFVIIFVAGGATGYMFGRKLKQADYQNQISGLQASVIDLNNANQVLEKIDMDSLMRAIKTRNIFDQLNFYVALFPFSYHV